MINSLSAKPAVAFAIAAAFVSLNPDVSKAATILPVTIDFEESTDYDSNFKEPANAANDGISWISPGATPGNGRLSVGSGLVATAVFDTSATGGAGGAGGSGGGDVNNDLLNFTASATLRTNALSSSSQVGFFVRLDSNESNGYLALASLDTSSGIRFRLFSASSASAPTTGTNIFDNESTRGAGGDIAANTNYRYQFTAQGNVFTFKLLSADGTTTLREDIFTDTTNGGAGYKVTAGQLGLRMLNDSATPGSATVVDNFSVQAVPEPTAIGAAAVGGLFLMRRHRTLADFR
ncbi:MAG TPA: hypothetical protein VGN72_18180 [Tepidisphaeraceae bacterium]|nr:hypothetical protein [Tepidisphaeraceae bacterium]